MPRKVDLVIVCEDTLHETFMRAFLYRRGFTAHDLTFRKAPHGQGDAKQNVCELLCKELAAIRRFASPGRGLVFVMDADNLTTDARRRCIEEACKALDVPPPAEEEPVFGIIPKWEIENWLAYLRDEAVDEQSNAYNKYTGCESKVYPLAERLADMCERKELPGAPPSLVKACAVYAKFTQWRKARQRG